MIVKVKPLEELNRLLDEELAPLELEVSSIVSTEFIKEQANEKYKDIAGKVLEVERINHLDYDENLNPVAFHFVFPWFKAEDGRTLYGSIEPWEIEAMEIVEETVNG